MLKDDPVDLNMESSPQNNEEPIDEEDEGERLSTTARSPSITSPPPLPVPAQPISPPAVKENNKSSNSAPVKWSSQTVYLRVMGRKGGPNSGDGVVAKPFKPSPMNYTIMGLFSKESNEVSNYSMHFEHSCVRLDNVCFVR